MKINSKTLLALMMGASISYASAETVTIATVNNGDMIRMQKLTSEFNKQHPDINVKWVTLEENVLRQRITTDIATKGGQYDIITIGMYEVPIWGQKGWLKSLNDMPASYDMDDLLPAVRGGLTVNGNLYASPFNAESSFVMYRKDLMAKADLTMPKAPTWDFIAKAARAMTDRSQGINGICLRGKAGWGENMAFITAMANSFGARWFDENWRAQFDTKEWKDTLTFYLDLMKEAGPKGASSNGFSANLALFQTGKCGMWIDATTAASFIIDPRESTVADHVGFAQAPDKGLGRRAAWLWSWSLAIPESSQKTDTAKKFINWATNKAYLELVASKEGWANVPPGTRKSLYANPEYQKVPFVKLTLDSINSVDPTNPAVKPVPYVGVQFVAIPEFQGIATAVGQQFSAALAGKISVDEALNNSQNVTTRTMKKAGYK